MTHSLIKLQTVLDATGWQWVLAFFFCLVISKTENAFDKRGQMGEGEVCLWKKWAFQNLHRLISSLIQGKVPLMESPYTESVSGVRNRLCYAFGGGYKRNKLWTLSLRKFLPSREKKKFLHMKLLTNIWGIISTRKKKNAFCAKQGLTTCHHM